MHSYKMYVSIMSINLTITSISNLFYIYCLRSYFNTSCLVNFLEGMNEVFDNR